jgi:hypothetical protein
VCYIEVLKATGSNADLEVLAAIIMALTFKKKKRSLMK